MHILNISRQLIRFCAELQNSKQKPRITKRCPIALAADAKGLLDATANSNYLTWKEHPGTNRRVRAKYSRTIVDWVRRFDRNHRYPNRLRQYVPPLAIRVAKLRKPTTCGATHIVLTDTKLPLEYISRTPRRKPKTVSQLGYGTGTKSPKISQNNNVKRMPYRKPILQNNIK